MAKTRALPPSLCSPEDPVLQAEIDRFYQDLPEGMAMRGLSAGVVLADVCPGNPPVILKCYSGYADLKEKRPVDNDTVFEIGSTTKTFTTTMLAAAVKDGAVDLKKTAQSYYDCYEPSVRLPVYRGHPATGQARAITLLDLADYTSGLPDKSPTNLKGPNEYPFSSMHEYLAGISLPVEPGTDYKYVNTNFAIIAELLMLVGGFREYEDALKWLIRHAGLEMGHTGVITSNTPSIDHLATGYWYDGRASEDYGMWTWPALQGAGGIYSTIDDMIRWLQFNMGLTESDDNDLLPRLHEVRFPEGAETGQGLGWFIAKLPGTSLKLIEKNGDTGTAGFHSWIGFLPEAKIGCVLLCNTSMQGAPKGGTGGAPVDNLGRAILGAFATAP